MEIRNLNTFLRVASLQNFTKASEELGYSQSNVSAQIKQLEHEIGFPLFDRIGRGVFLTSYGEALLPYARQIIATVLQIENFMRSDEVLEGTIRIGLTDSLSELSIDNALLRYHRRFPKVHLELTIDSTVALLELLQHGLLDAACLIGDALSASGWIIWDMVEIPIVLVANPSHPLSQRETISLKMLSEQELILMEASAPYSRQFEQTLASHHLECQPFLRLQSADTARRLVEQGLFLSVLPLYTVQSSIQAGRLCRIAVQDWTWSQYVQLVLHQSKAITPQIQGILEELRLSLGDILAEKLSSNEEHRR